MQHWKILLLVTFLSALTSALVVMALQPAPPLPRNEALAASSLEHVHLALAGLTERQDELDGALTELRRRAPAPTGSTRVAVGEVEAAVARWMEERGLGRDLSALTDRVEEKQLAHSVATANLNDLMDALLGGGLGEAETQELWQRVREEGRLDELIAEFQRRAELDPLNPDLQVELAGALLQKVFEVGNGPLAGKYGMMADEAYDRALALDDTHWEARFSKAVALSNWPDFLGKTGEAIRHFETLVEQQKNGPNRPEYAGTYFLLGNMYLKTGDREKALQIWQDGLALFPGDQMLLEQLSNNR